LDEGIGDTFVSVAGRTAHTLPFPSALRTAPESLAQHTSKLLPDELANLVSFRLRLVEPQLAGSNYSRGFEWTGLIWTNDHGPALGRGANGLSRVEARM